MAQDYQRYLRALRSDFTKLAKLEFLQPDGTVAFTIDNNARNIRAPAFLQGGTITCNLQNGMRRQADITLANVTGDYDYAVNKVWFGQQIRLQEGLLLPDGTEYYIPQGVYEIQNPVESRASNSRQMSYHLVDKWANLNGELGGNLEGPYSVTAGTNIFAAMASLLLLDRYTMESPGTTPIDRVTPLFTSYYNGKTQTLTDGSVVSLADAPYDFISGDNGTIADVLLGLNEMIAGLIGYSPAGRLVVDPSQDDILDVSKPVLWDFSMDEKQLLSPLSYTFKNTDVYNDVIVVGATNDVNFTARGRAQNRDPASDTCISRIGLKTKRIPMSNYYSNDICEAYAEWMLKRYATLSKSITLSCTQMFHIVENGLITIRRTDKPGSPIERHIVQGFTRPIAQTGAMTINAISASDFPIATIIRQ